MNLPKVLASLGWGGGSELGISTRLPSVRTDVLKVSLNQESVSITLYLRFSQPLFLGCNVLWSCGSLPTFRNNIPPYSGLKISLVSCLAYSSTVKIEAIRYFEASFNFLPDYTALRSSWLSYDKRHGHGVAEKQKENNTCDRNQNLQDP
jgi:hypothetical protein